MDVEKRQGNLPPGVTALDERDDSRDDVFLADPDDEDTMSYFPPSVSTSSFPALSAASAPSLIHFLLEAADVSTDLYPPQSWEQLKVLVDAIEQDSQFDTLRRNALIFYLLLDYHLFPSVATLQAKHNASHVLNRLSHHSVLDRFCINRVLPRFWRDSVEKGFWRFDKGFFEEAMPWLNADNSTPYTRHILATLDPTQAPAEATQDVSRSRAECVEFFMRLANPDITAQLSDASDEEAGQTLFIIAVSRAIVAGLPSAIDFLRGTTLTLPGPSQQLLPELWSWLFSYKGQAKRSLLSSAVSTPLTPKEASSFRDIALCRSSVASIVDATALALDTLLVRLLNQGQILEALRVNKLAEASQVTASDFNGGTASVTELKRRRKRREMLRLATDMLPETLRSQLDDMTLGSGDESMQPADPVVVLPSAHERHKPAKPDQDVQDASISVDERNTSLSVPGYRIHPAERSKATSPSGPAQVPSTLQKRILSTQGAQRSLSLTSQSPFAGRASPGGSRIASPATGHGAAASTSLSKSRLGQSVPNAAEPEVQNDGPYARLAAQLLAQSRQQQSVLPDASKQQDGDGANESGSNAFLSSLLPQKRDVSGGAAHQQRKPVVQANDFAMDEDAVQGSHNVSNSGFEVPKRRYIAKKQTTAAEEAGARPDDVSRKAKKSQHAPASSTGRSTRLRRAQVEREHEEEADEEPGHVSADFEPVQPVARARIPSAATMDNLSSQKAKSKRSGASKNASAKSADAPAKTAALRASRSQSALSQSIPGSWPGEEQEEDEVAPDADHDAQTSQPEMIELPTNKRSVTAAKPTTSQTTRPKRKAAANASEQSAVPLTSTPARRSARASSAKPTTAQPPRRSTRSQSVASSQLDDEDERDDFDNNEELSHSPGVPRKSTRSTRGRRGSSVSQQGGGGSGGRRLTRSMSVLSQQSSHLGEEEEEEVGEDAEHRSDEEEGSVAAGDDEEDADETPKKRPSTTTSRKGATSTRRRRK